MKYKRNVQSYLLRESLNNGLIIGQHIVKGVVELIRDLLDLKFFSVDFVFNVIDSVVQLSNVALSVFISGFSNLESIHKIENFVLQFLFPLGCFLGRDFKLLHVFTDSFKLSLNILKFSFCQFCSFGSSFALIFLYSKLSGDFVKFLFIVASHFGSFSQVFIALFKFHFVVHGFVFKEFNLLQDSISFFGHHCQFGTVSAKAVSAFFASSSINITRLLSAPTSSSAFLNSFSFSSYVAKTLVNLSLVSSNSTS